MRISDWSSDVCSSDLLGIEIAGEAVHASRIIYLLETGEAGPVDRGLSIIGAPGVESQDVDAFPCSDRSAKAAARAYSQCIGARAQIYITRSEEHTYELQSLMRISYAVSRLKKKIQ